MPQYTKVKQLIVNQLSKEQYKQAKLDNILSNEEIYIITDDYHYTELEIQALLATKQDKLTTSGRINIDDNNIITIDLTDYYSKFDIDSNLGSSLSYENSILTLISKDGKILSNVTIKSTPDVDGTTIHLNNSEQLEVIGNITKDGTTKYDWIGTKEEYEQGLTSGLITNNTACYIINDETDLISGTDISLPTKLSDFTNDVNFISKEMVDNSLNLKVDKEEGKSLVSDTEILRLSSLKDYDDTKIKQDINDLKNNKVNKEEGKSLISDTEILRLSNLKDYDDTSLVNNITELQINKLNPNLNNINKDGESKIKEIIGNTLSLFDIVQKDHVLSFEESKGLAMLGSYVYKNGVAGSRYGYADFYEKCLEEYRNSESATIPSVTVTGSIANNDGVLSEFSNGGYVIPEPDITVASGQSFELALNVKTGDTANGVIVDFGRNGQIVGLLTVADGQLQLLMVSLDSANMIPCGTLSLNKSHDIVMNYSNSVLTVKVNGETTYTSGVFTTAQMTFCFGGQHNVGDTFTGAINLKKSYITVDNQVVWGDIYKKSANGHTFYDIANKSTVDQLFESRGEAMFYGIDEENERIFLPRRTRTQTTLNPDEVNGFVEAGLPNITGYGIQVRTLPGSPYQETSGAIYFVKSNGDLWSSGSVDSQVAGFDASLSNPIYGNSDTVQPSGSLVLEYMVVGNVITKDIQTNVTEITTSENDTLPLFYNFYSDKDMTTTGAYANASLGIWLSGNIYTTAYNELVNKLGTSNVKSITDTFTDYDFVVNQDDMTFRLPLLNGSENLPADKVVAFAPSASGDKFTAPANGWFIGHIIATSATTPTNVQLKNDTTGYRDVSNTYGSDSYSATAKVFCKKDDVITMAWGANSTSPVLQFVYAQGNGNLYYKIANAVTNLELLDAGEILSATNNLIPNNKTVWDGQWVGKYLLLSNTKAVGTYMLDLSEYLPNDGYIYEVLVKIANTNNESGTNAYVNVGSDIIVDGNPITVGSDSNLGGVSIQASGILPVRNHLIYSISATTTSASVAVFGYRRIGTNQ